MRCEQVQPWLGAWQAGEVGAWRRWQIARHVRQCAECQAEAVALTQLSARLKNADPVTDYHQPLAVPVRPRFGVFRYAALATTLALVTVTGVYTSRSKEYRSMSVAGRPVAVRPQKTQKRVPLVLPAVKTQKLVARMAQRPAIILPREKRFGERKHLVVASAPVRVRLPNRPGRRQRIPSVVAVLTAGKKPTASVVATEKIPLPKPQPEIIQVSVKLCDSHDIARQLEKEAALIEAAEARREIISVRVVPAPLEKVLLAPSTSPVEKNTRNIEAIHEDL